MPLFGLCFNFAGFSSKLDLLSTPFQHLLATHLRLAIHYHLQHYSYVNHTRSESNSVTRQSRLRGKSWSAWRPVTILGLSTAADQPRHCHPLWHPVAVFYSALVIWGRVREDEARSRSSHILLPLRRLLYSFQSELESLKEDWRCAGQMAEVIAKLIS